MMRKNLSLMIKRGRGGLVLIAACVLFFAGCKDDDSNDSTLSADLVGIWETSSDGTFYASAENRLPVTERTFTIKNTNGVFSAHLICIGFAPVAKNTTGEMTVEGKLTHDGRNVYTISGMDGEAAGMFNKRQVTIKLETGSLTISSTDPVVGGVFGGTYTKSAK
jgi:hypothetical protein